MTIVLALSACGKAGNSSQGAGGDTSPIKIGAMFALTGSLAAASQANLAAVKVAANEANAAGGINGRQLSVVSFDDQGTASVNVGGLHTLANEGVHFVVGGQYTPICQADEGLLQQLNVLFMNANCTTDSLTGSGVNPLFFRVGANNEYVVGGVVKTVCSQFTGITRFDMINEDYALTQNLEAAIKQGLSTGCGVTEGTSKKVPLTATDMLSYMTDVGTKVAPDAQTNDVLIVNLFGTAMPNAIKLGVSTGLFAKYKYVLAPSTDDTAEIASQASLGSSMPLLYQISDYSAAESGAVNSKFVADFKAATGSEPPAVAAEAYRATVALIAALRKANSTDPSKVSQTLLASSFDDFTGAEAVDAGHQGAVQMVLHTFGPTGPQIVATYTSADVLGSLKDDTQQLMTSLKL